MSTRRTRDLLTQKTEPIPFAAKAKDLGALRDAVVDAASVSAGLWISYLFALFYFAIAAGAVTHRDLLLESPVKLPFLNVELPLKAFFILGPLVFLIVHTYVLLHFVLLAGKIGAFHSELQAQISGDDARARLRRQLPSNIFVQSLAGPREVRTGIIGFLLRRIIEISLVAGPIALLILFQLQFLPYHSEWITMWQRIAVVIDLILLWILWPPIARGETTQLWWIDFQQGKVWALLLASFLPVLLAVTIATFPGEWLEEKLPSVRLIPTTWEAWTLPSIEVIQAPGSGWATLHELLVAGKVNYVTGRPQSLWSNVLVLPRFEVGDRVKFDPEGKIAISSDAMSLRGRSLEGAMLVNARLKKADFEGASLANANFIKADLREAKFNCDLSVNGKICTQLRGVSFNEAQLQGASFDGAQLQMASLVGADLQGASLNDAQLQGASLDYAQLKGASLHRAWLQGASLNYAELQGASFINAQMEGASLIDSDLQGASFRDALLTGAELGSAKLQGASFVNTDLRGAGLNSAQLQGASLMEAHMIAASLSGAELQGASFYDPELPGLKPAELEDAFLSKIIVWRISGEPHLNGALIEEPDPEPEYYCKGEAKCHWSDSSYAKLKAQIEDIPADSARDEALRRIAPLEVKPYIGDPISAKRWLDLASASKASATSYPKRLAEDLIGLGCKIPVTPPMKNSEEETKFRADLGRRLHYVIHGLIDQLNWRFYSNPLQKAEIAAAFLNEASCRGARGLSKEDKANLQEIRDRGLPASAGPGTGAR